MFQVETFNPFFSLFLCHRSNLLEILVFCNNINLKYANYEKIIIRNSAFDILIFVSTTPGIVNESFVFWHIFLIEHRKFRRKWEEKRNREKWCRIWTVLTVKNCQQIYIFDWCSIFLGEHQLTCYSGLEKNKIKNAKITKRSKNLEFETKYCMEPKYGTDDWTGLCWNQKGPHGTRNVINSVIVLFLEKTFFVQNFFG